MTEGSERARVAYDAFRGGFKDDGICPVPHWDEAPGWVRDVVFVAYLQGTLDAPKQRSFYGAECQSWPNCNGGCGLGCIKEIERSRVHQQITTEGK